MDDLKTRWLIRRDVDAALALPAMLIWDAEDMEENLALNHGIGKVCEDGERIVGWIAYELGDTHFHITNIGSDHWTCGGAAVLVQDVINRLGRQRDIITITVPDYSDDILVFLRSCGFVVWQQTGSEIQMRYDVPLSSQLVEIGGETCRRSSGFPCMIPEDMR